MFFEMGVMGEKTQTIIPDEQILNRPNQDKPNFKT